MQAIQITSENMFTLNSARSVHNDWVVLFGVHIGPSDGWNFRLDVTEYDFGWVEVKIQRVKLVPEHGRKY